jgi:predicted transcriptional regulator
MSTTSLKLHDELKQRAATVAQNQGVSPHAFMVQAIEMATQAAEQRADFVATALAAREKILTTGKGYDAEEVHAYIKARLDGKKVAKPRAKSWRR